MLRRLARSPLLGATALVGLAALWNVGLMRLAETGVVPDAAPWERVAAAQARQAGQLTEAGLGGLFGDAGRALAYKARSGEYLYWNLNLSGTFDLGRCEGRYLLGEWSEPENREGPATFRWALYPRSCLRFPLERPVDLRSLTTARAPGRLAQPQQMTVTLNGTPLASTALGREWQDVPVLLPAAALRSGENVLCFEFATGLAGDGGERAAAISRVQLP